MLNSESSTPALTSLASYQITAHKHSNGPGSADEIPTNPLLRWWDAYPPAQSQAPPISVEELAALMKDKAFDFAVIDVRRDDHGVGCFELFVVFNVRNSYKSLVPGRSCSGQRQLARTNVPR